MLYIIALISENKKYINIYSILIVVFIHELKLEPLSYKKMDFQEFCASSISPHQLEALENWENIASAAFEYFEEEGNRVTSVEELAQVCITTSRKTPLFFYSFFFSSSEE